jgi:high-affinity nickel-transport protein
MNERRSRNQKRSVAMITLISLLFFGFFLGMRHATDADHVIAEATIVSKERKIGNAARLGLLWGIGHTVTILIAGGAIILFSVVIPRRLSLTMEFCVAVMLIVLGIMNLGGFIRWIIAGIASGTGRESRVHIHPHSHGDYVHSHAHNHNPEMHGHHETETPQGWLDRTFGGLGLYHALRPIIVGIVHGLAGSAALALLLLTTIRDPHWAMAYLLVFGLGTIAGMMFITTAIALPFTYTASRFARANRHLATVSGLLSLGFGLFLVYQIGFVDGLFKGEP